MCVRSVCWLIPSSSAIFSGGSPSAIRWRICSSRGVSRSIRWARFPSVGPAPAELPEGLLDLGARVERLATVGATDRVGEAAHGFGLAQVAAGPRLDRAGQRHVVVLSRQDDHGRARSPIVDPAGRLDAVDAGHLQVHQHHVGHASRTAVSTAGGAVGDDLDHAEVLFLVQGDLERFAERTVVVGDDDGDRSSWVGFGMSGES